jgi:cyanophycin synthetase
MCDMTDHLKVRGRRIVVLAAPGDRRDEDIADIGRAAAGHFDHYICRRDDGLRGRKSDEVPRMLRAALMESGVPAEAIELVPDEAKAVDHALHMARPGDLLLLFADALQRTWNEVLTFRPDVEHTPLDERVDPAPVRVEDLSSVPLLDDGRPLVRDARGVRLAAREPEIAD